MFGWYELRVNCLVFLSETTFKEECFKCCPTISVHATLYKKCFSPHSPWEDNIDQSHRRSTLCEHLYQGHWRKANHHQDNQSCWVWANNNKSGRGRGTFNHQNHQGHWESTNYYPDYKSYWRQVSKSAKMVHIWVWDVTNRNFPLSRGKSWCRGQDAYRLVGEHDSWECSSCIS